MSPLRIANRKKDALNPHAEATIHFTPYTAILRNKRRVPPGLSSIAEWVAVIQGLYYCLKERGPFYLLPPFWQSLVCARKGGDQTTGLLLLVMGVVFLIAALRSVLSLELGILIIGCSLGLGLLDMFTFFKSGPSTFYMADGIEEFVVFSISLICLQHFTHRRHSTYI